MSLTDKVSGRIKQAAGDLLGDENVRRQGQDEERKGDAKAELRKEEQRAEGAEARAQTEAEKADARAEAAAEREYAKSDSRVAREEARADTERSAAQARADEVEHLERRT